MTALEFSPIAQRYHVQSTYAGKPNDEFLVNVDRESKTAQVFQRRYDKKWSDWGFVGRFDAVGRPESDE